MESGVQFVAADFPQANRLTIHILAAIAEYEAKLISERVKAAIVASKARGVVWGGNRNAPTAHPNEARRIGNEGRKRRAVARAIDLEPLIMEMRESGKSLAGIAAELTARSENCPAMTYDSSWPLPPHCNSGKMSPRQRSRK